MERSANYQPNDAGKQKPGDRGRALDGAKRVAGAWDRAPANPQRATADAQSPQMSLPSCVQIIGDFDHPDFRDALALLRLTANLAVTTTNPPELILVAQSRSGMFPIREVEALRRAAPLAGMVALAGTWCEGEPRTGRPWPGIRRLYWYEFPAWWHRQLAIRAAGKCPDWARPANSELRIADHPAGSACGLRIDSAAPRGTIVVNSAVRETADSLSDSLCRAGHTTLWQRSSCTHDRFRGAIAGIWDGGQLNEREARQLATFCRQLSTDGAPVVALLDFPRRDRVDRAISLGAAAVLGKPWLNIDLVATLQMAAAHTQPRRAA